LSDLRLNLREFDPGFILPVDQGLSVRLKILEAFREVFLIATVFHSVLIYSFGRSKIQAMPSRAQMIPISTQAKAPIA
jgi:hypothetical protein